MKNLHQAEKHLADKLQNVPVPDVDQSWEQMRSLLEQEMPEPVAGAWSGNRKWWWMGITVGIIMLATWLTQELNDADALKANKLAAQNAIENKSVGQAEKNTAVTIDNSSKSKNENNSSANSTKTNDISVANETAIVKSETKLVAPANNEANVDESPAKVSKTEINKNNKSVKKSTSVYVNTKQKETQLVTQSKVVPKNDVVFNNNSINNPSSITLPISDNNNEADASTINTSLITETQVSSPADAFNEINNFEPEQLAINGKTDRAFARELRRKSMKADNRRLSRSSMRGGSADKEHEITFAAGLALPQSLAISGQQSSAYNINAKTSRITDYLPAPFFQYHINNKLFLQTEFHFQSPQYTQRLLLSQFVDSSANRRLESNVHLEKLYYFNIPFNVYYSPARNFFIGGGLQYSSLLGGVASFEERRSEGQQVLSYNSETRRFRDDSVAAKFSPSEWRYQFDANYYLKRFTLGLRFNQAMRDFVDIQQSSFGPATRDRNRSFLLYLRFNIWEERKKQ